MSRPDQAPATEPSATGPTFHAHCATAYKASRKKVPRSQYLQGYDQGLRDGETAMARVFWQGVCEKKAQKKEKKAAYNRGLARYDQKWLDHGESVFLELANQRLAEAAQLRAWAVDTDESMDKLLP